MMVKVAKVVDSTLPISNDLSLHDICGGKNNLAIFFKTANDRTKWRVRVFKSKQYKYNFQN